MRPKIDRVPSSTSATELCSLLDRDGAVIVENVLSLEQLKRLNGEFESCVSATSPGIEFPDHEQRKKALALMVGIEDLVWVKIGAAAKIFAIADEDLDRSTSEKTSSVHFLRFELLSDQAKNLDASIPIVFGIDHKNYQYQTNICTTTKESIIKDLDQT
mgnify:CR=1 FL=1